MYVVPHWNTKLYNDKSYELELKNLVKNDIEMTLNSFKRSERGVYVQASSLGSLEALLDYLRDNDIPVSNLNIGPVKRKDILKAAATSGRAYACILAFDVPVKKSAATSAT